MKLSANMGATPTMGAPMPAEEKGRVESSQFEEHGRGGTEERRGHKKLDFCSFRHSLTAEAKCTAVSPIRIPFQISAPALLFVPEWPTPMDTCGGGGGGDWWRGQRLMVRAEAGGEGGVASGV
jgi:hypothetical protein